MGKPWPEFAEAMRQRESGGDYQVVNRFGYMGAYQFGLLRLQDLGIVDAQGNWLKGLTKQKFLDSPTVQDATFVAHVARLAKIITERYEKYLDSMSVGDAPVTLSGCVAVAHLLGLGGVSDLLSSQIDRRDGLGTTATDYLREFAGYDIPSSLPMALTVGGDDV